MKYRRAFGRQFNEPGHSFAQMIFRSSVLIAAIMIFGGSAVRYPNEIVDTPLVSCEPERIVIKIRTSTANPSNIAAEDFHHSPNCAARNENTLSIRHGECGMTTERLENPSGVMYRICVAVQIHPLFVTDSDRSYCAQCVYMDNSVVDDLEQNIAISEIPPSELEPQFDDASNPRCTYSIRKGSFNGPEVHAAVVGETVYHVWQCNNANIGLLVQNCHVEDLQGDKILIIDQNGCGVDQYLFKTPQYSPDLQTAVLESNVFKFVDKSMTRFRCQLRLCVKNRGVGCAQVTPPSSCPNGESEDPFPVEDISDRLRTNPDAAVVAGAPIHSRPSPLQTSTASARLGRPYGLSTAHNVIPAARPVPPPVVADRFSHNPRRRRNTVTANGTVLRRRRRAIEVTAETKEALDVVGLIRVLDSPDDEFDRNADRTEGDIIDNRKCLSMGTYWILLGTFSVVLSIQMGLMAMAVVQRLTNGRRWLTS